MDGILGPAYPFSVPGIPPVERAETGGMDLRGGRAGRTTAST